MFKSKHVFTCPDVIYLMDKQKKYNRIALAINGVFFGGLFIGAKMLEASENKKLNDLLEETPTES